MARITVGRLAVTLAGTGFCILSAGVPHAAVVTGWDTGNVVVGPAGTSGVSVVYDRDVSGGTAGAVTNGQIAYDFPEADSPGIKVLSGPFTTGGQTTAGCILASSAAVCDGPFQSGKRFKQQVTGFGPTDLVFDVETGGEHPEGSETGWQVFQAITNLTGSQIAGVTFELGFGVGDQFQTSAPGDGLGFSPAFEFGPGDLAASTQIPFGLFGDADTNPNQTLSGFFDPTARAGLTVDFSEDVLQTDGFFGIYDDLFGHLLDRDEVPLGGFWDNDGDPETDAILMAWLNDEGLWEVRREIVGGEPVTLEDEADIQQFASLQEAQDFLAAQLGAALLLETNLIEDLAKFNANYAILFGEGFDADSFTLRVTAQPQPVPLPAGLPMALTAMAVLGIAGGRRRA